MSRGHGILQQRIINYLGQFEHRTAEHISWALRRIHGAPISMPSLRRALRALESEGAVINEGTPRNDIWQLSEEMLRLAKIRTFNEEKDRKAEAARARRERKQNQDYEKIYEELGLPKRSARNIDRIPKLLEMLGSDHDGEVLAAARKLHNYRIKWNQSWDDILRQYSLYL
jgi:DNA polymerase III delta prime subunit